MTEPVVVIAMYRPKDGKTPELDALMRRHFPTLQEYGLTTTKAPFLGRASDGTIVEIFEWASAEAARRAHDHPAVAKIWEAMAVIAEFGRLEQLPEVKKVFPQFARAFPGASP